MPITFGGVRDFFILMHYLSRLLGARVENIGGETYGRVIDVIACIPQTAKQDFPQVVGFVVQVKRQVESRYVRMEHVQEVNGRQVVLRAAMTAFTADIPRGDQFFSLKKSVLDKQIVDLAGVRIVRVNDVELDWIRGVLHVVSLDVSNQALFRRLGLPQFLLFQKSKPNLLEWKDIQVIGNHLQVEHGVSDIVRLHPADIANIVEQLNVKRGSVLLQSLDRETAARVLEEVQPDVQRLLVTSLGPERAASLMARMSIDELVDLIQQLPSAEAQAIIDELPGDKTAQHLKHILSYDEDTAGGLMTTEFVSAQPTDTVATVMEKIKQVSEQFRSIHFVYIIDEKQTFLGVVSLRKLIISDPGTPMSTFIDRGEKIPTVTADRSVSSVGRRMTKYNLHAIAVLGPEQTLLGVVTADDIMRRLFPKA